MQGILAQDVTLSEWESMAFHGWLAENACKDGSGSEQSNTVFRNARNVVLKDTIEHSVAEWIGFGHLESDMPEQIVGSAWNAQMKSNCVISSS